MNQTKKALLPIFIFLLLNTLLLAQKRDSLDVIISNTAVVDVINKKIITGQYIGIQNGRIRLIDSGNPKLPTKRKIDGYHLIALPGFINTHTHLWQHICKACFPNESLQKWIGVYSKIHSLEPKELYDVVLAASCEALLSGITTVSDYASLGFNDYGFDENARAMHDAGLGRVIVWNNPSVFLPDDIKELEIARFKKKLEDHFSIWMGFGPLSFNSLPQVYSGIRLARKLNMSMSEHTMENNQEQRDFYDALSKYVAQYGDRLSEEDRLFFTNLLNARKPSNNDAYEALIQQATNILETDDRLKSTKDYLPLTDSEKNKLVAIQEPRNFSPLEVLKYFEILHEFLSIHSVWPQKEDIEIMKANSVSISHNPESNLYLSSGLAPIQDYIRAGLTVSLGTDGAASNDAIDFFSAMKAMWNMAKIRILEIPASSEMNEWTVLQAATINGAKALKLEVNTGSLEVGKEADITLISLEELGMSPARPDSMTARLLIYSASPKNIKYVLSDGRVIVENGKLKKYSEQKLSNDLTSIAKKVDQRITTGKLWKDNYTLRTFGSPYWYKYRSIRIKDSVNINFFNATNNKVKLTLVSSALVFSGGSPYVVNSDVSSRFPEDTLPKAFKREISLENKQGVQIIKPKNSYDYIITVDGQSTNVLSDRGQLLILCEPIKK